MLQITFYMFAQLDAKSTCQTIASNIFSTNFPGESCSGGFRLEVFAVTSFCATSQTRKLVEISGAVSSYLHIYLYIYTYSYHVSARFSPILQCHAEAFMSAKRGH